MKYLDRFLRDWRINKCCSYIRNNDKVLDIGCLDGTLFKVLEHKGINNSIGLDPLLKKKIVTNNYTLLPGKFPEGLNKTNNKQFDAIVLLAVLEHIPRIAQQQLNSEFKTLLNPLGRIIITVPSPFVDYILYVLNKLKLIDGMSVEEHYGFKVAEVPELFNKNDFKLIKHKKFQLGLNNLFVFEKLP